MRLRKAKRPYPLISGDVGPYAAYLATVLSTVVIMVRHTVLSRKFHRPHSNSPRSGVSIYWFGNHSNHLVYVLIELLAEEFVKQKFISVLYESKNQNYRDGTSLDEITQFVSHQTKSWFRNNLWSSPLLYNQALTILKMLEKLITYPNSGEAYDGSDADLETQTRCLTLVNTARIGMDQFGVKILVVAAAHVQMTLKPYMQSLELSQI